MIQNIEIKDFRGLQNIDISMGNYITAIAGKNGLGKSTILALLGNTCELKGKEGKTLFGTQFRTEFSEIFKADKKFDKSGGNKCIINFSKTNLRLVNESKICRVTWQAGVRFRLIPETITKGMKNSRKKEWPSLYLGLSRLYPIGEAADEGINIKGAKMTIDEKENFLRIYNSILGSYSEDIDLDIITINETNRKKGVCINTKEYSSITNSAGQDNIGQIILAVLSFKKLKLENKSYEGGLLLIDEIEATLHPYAQNKLIDFLIRSAKELNLQVVFTTHSLSLLKNICMRTRGNIKNGNNNCEIYYFTRANGRLDTHRNPTYTIIENDLCINAPGANIKKITVYTEDEEGRWFFEKLVEKYLLRLNLVKIKLGCNNLIDLNKNDPEYFSNVLFILDGDVEDKKVENKKNMVKLPGDVRPEEVIYNFLMNLSPESEFWIRGFDYGLTKESLEIHGPNSSEYQGKDRERYKKWFQENKRLFEALDLIGLWIENNQDEFVLFESNFKSAFNKIAQRKLISHI